MWPYSWTHVGTPSQLGHIDRVAATMPSQAHAGAAQEAHNIGQWEGQDVPLVRPSSCIVKGGIPSSRRYLPTYLTRGNKRYTLTLGLFQTLYQAMLTHCQHMAMGALLMTFFYGLVPQTATCNTCTNQHGTQITPTHSSITKSLEQTLVNYNSHSHLQCIPLLNSFTMDITSQIIFKEPVKVASGNALALHDLATRYTPLSKWQKIFKRGGTRCRSTQA